MKKQIPLTWAVFLIALLPAGYLALTWSSLPQTVPVHFGPTLTPDRFGDKSELWIISGILAGVSIFLYFLLSNLQRIDPKRRKTAASATFNRLAFGLVVFMAALNIIIIASAKGSMVLQNFLFPLLGLLFAFIGNYMNNIKPNYFAGIRLPWTLSSDENWRRTHNLAGKLWFGGGLLIVLVSFFLPSGIMFFVFVSVMLVITLIPVAYSYRMFKQHA